MQCKHFLCNKHNIFKSKLIKTTTIISTVGLHYCSMAQDYLDLVHFAEQTQLDFAISLQMAFTKCHFTINSSC